VPVCEIPDSDQLRQIVQWCSDYLLRQCTTPEQRTQNGEDFFARALALLDSPTMPVLRIGDYGTTGLEAATPTR